MFSFSKVSKACLGLMLFCQITLFASLQIRKDNIQQSSKKSDLIVLAEVLEHHKSSKIISQKMKGDIEWTVTQYTNSYSIKIKQTMKGSMTKDKKIEVQFVYSLSSAKRIPKPSKDPNVIQYAGPMSVSQMIPGSGKENGASKGEWVFFCKGRNLTDGIYKALRIDSLKAYDKMENEVFGKLK